MACWFWDVYSYSLNNMMVANCFTDPVDADFTCANEEQRTNMNESKILHNKGIH